MSEIHDRPGVRTELAYMASGQLSDVLELLKGRAPTQGDCAWLEQRALDRGARHG